MSGDPYEKLIMEETKKPKRPRIGETGANIANDYAQNNDGAHYEKVNYPSHDPHSATGATEGQTGERPARPY